MNMVDKSTWAVMKPLWEPLVLWFEVSRVPLIYCQISTMHDKVRTTYNVFVCVTT